MQLLQNRSNEGPARSPALTARGLEPATGKISADGSVAAGSGWVCGHVLGSTAADYQREMGGGVWRTAMVPQVVGTNLITHTRTICLYCITFPICLRAHRCSASRVNTPVRMSPASWKQQTPENQEDVSGMDSQ